MHSNAELHAELARVVRADFPRTVQALSALVKTPSVSWPGFDPTQMSRSAQQVTRLFTALGAFDSVQAVTADTPSGEPGHPAVLATRKAAPGMPTVLLYAHHDVQPPGPSEAWESEPFVPTLRGKRLYGRGASDDKAGIVTHVAAISALLRVLEGNGLGIKVFIEGEEEYGSPSFPALLEQNRKALEADAIVIADSSNWDTKTPALTTTLRGNITFRLRLQTLDHPLHSGMFGGAVPDAMLAMVRLLSSLHDADGRVAVAGLESFAAVVPAYSEERLRQESGLLDGVDAVGEGPLLSRIWNQPAITVTGLDATPVAEASNTLAAALQARVSVRVAPGQGAHAAYEAVAFHLEKHTPFGASIEIDELELGEAFKARSDAVTEQMLAAMQSGWGTEPVLSGIGGSIPFISQLVEQFPEATVLITGVEDPDTRAHSPNESQDLEVLQKAILTEAIFLAELCSPTN